MGLQRVMVMPISDSSPTSRSESEMGTFAPGMGTLYPGIQKWSRRKTEPASLEKEYIARKLLPPAQDAGKPCLVLDLDETLIHCDWTPSRNYDFKREMDYHGKRWNLYFKKRPGCDEFLAQAAAQFELVVFTASHEQYCDLVLQELDPLGLISHRLNRLHCIKTKKSSCLPWRNRPVFVKDLERLGRNLEECIILDNDPDAYR